MIKDWGINMAHYDKERENELDKKRKIEKKGQIVFMVALAFIVISLLILY